MSLTPHGPGFSFIDSFEIIESQKRGRGRKWLDPAAPFFADHFPGNPLMPGVLLIECAAQAAGVLWQPSGGAFLAAVSQDLGRFQAGRVFDNSCSISARVRVVSTAAAR